jgi:aryl-alcohol dehydrogenase-like predicted oxidoreductase
MNDTHRLALGTVQFGLDYGISNSHGKPSMSEIEAILNIAEDSKIELLDTANAYGEAEQVIGLLNLNRFDVVTKFLPESQKGLFENQFQDSLNKLNVDNIYGLLAHRPLDVVQNPEIWNKVRAQKENLKVKKIGFSFDSPEEYYAVVKKSFFPDLVQIPFNYFDDRFIDIIEELKDSECEIHVRSAFLQGLFFTKTNQLPSFFDGAKEVIAELQKEYHKSLPAVLLSFVLNNKSVDKVVIGVQNRSQLQDVINCAKNVPLLKKQHKKINQKILQPSLWPK